MAGKYQVYPAYKSSGVGWVGDIPDAWDVIPLAVLCEFQQGKAHEPFIEDTGKFVCVNARFVSTEGIARKHCTQNLTPAKKDDILMVMSDLPNGRALAKAYFVGDGGPYAVNQRVCRLTAKRANSRFLFYQLSRNPYFLRYDDGSNQTHLSNAAFTKFPTLVPQLAEQHQIAAFLDYETAKIDALIAKQERLIALLEEKRQAVVSHAVTKGLNPQAPLRPSGIDWLGDIPVHWTHAPLKYMALEENSLFLDGDWIESKDLSDEGIRYITTGNVGAGAYKEQGQGYISQSTFKKIDATEVIEGDILVSRLNAPIGRACIVPELASRIVTSVDNVIFRPDAKFHRPYVVFMLSSQEYFAHTSNMARGATMQRISRGLLGNVRIAFPALSEQIEIANFLEREIEKFDALATNAQTAATLLKERRTALISAAVTGKIDVRDWQPPKDISDQDTVKKAFA